MARTKCCQEFLSPSWGPYCFSHILQEFLDNIYPVGFSGESDVIQPCWWALLIALTEGCADKHTFVWNCWRSCSSCLACSHPSLVKGLAAGWLHPHPPPAGPLMVSSLACSPSTVPCLSCTPWEKWRDRKYLINIKLRTESHLPKVRCCYSGPLPACTPWPLPCYSWSMWKLSAPTGGELHSLCLCGFGAIREAAGLIPLLFNLRERLQACRKQAEGEMRWWVREFMEMVPWLLGQCQPWFLTEGQCVVPAWPLPRVFSHCGSAEPILTLSTQECPGHQLLKLWTHPHPTYSVTL